MKKLRAVAFRTELRCARLRYVAQLARWGPRCLRALVRQEVGSSAPWPLAVFQALLALQRAMPALSQAASVADHPVDPIVSPDHEGIPLLVAVNPMDLEDDPQLPAKEGSLAEEEREDRVSMAPGSSTTHVRP